MCQAEDSIAAGVDWLAPSFGNIHGVYPTGGPKLEFDRLERIRDTVGDRVRLILHGAHEQYFQQELFRGCIDLGMSKVNINGVVNNACLETQQRLAGKASLMEIMEESTTAMQAVIETHCDWLMSAGKA